MTTQILLSALILFSCGCMAENKAKTERGQVTHEPFPKQLKTKVVQLADSVMKNEGFNLHELERTITEDSLYYQIHYVLKDSLSAGGGGIIMISKNNLKIVDKKFEQ